MGISYRRAVIAVLIAAALCGISTADTGSWSTSGPFANGMGNRVIYSIAVGSDGSAVNCGTGSGSVFSFSLGPAGPPVLSGTLTGTDPVTTTTESSGSSNSGRDSTYAITAPGSGADGTMTFAVNEPLSTGSTDFPFAITTVNIRPAESLGPTDLIVTDAGATANKPDGRTVAGIVAISTVGVNPSSIGSGTITFAVSSTWLSQHSLAPADIVLMRSHDGTWAELPTTYRNEVGNAYYFTATTPGFSYFAIVNRVRTAPADTTAVMTRETTTVLPGATKAAATVPSGLSPKTAASSRTSAPAAVSTTTVSDGTQSPTGFPVALTALAAAVIVVIIGAAWYIRRWWIRRQNPALFRDYD